MELSEEIFFQYERDAAEKASALRERGFTVETTAYEGGWTISVTGPPAMMEALYKEVAKEQRRRNRSSRDLTGTVRWWKDEKGYGRITGDDGYVYFCHFSAIEGDGYRSLRAGQRVLFRPVEGMADHGRAGAMYVRVIGEE